MVFVIFYLRKKSQVLLKHNKTLLSLSGTKMYAMQRKFLTACVFLCTHVNDMLVCYAKLAIFALITL
jgi:hypothetical protein